MADHRLKSIRIEGLTSILSAHVRLDAMNVLVGANGAGKSNFIQALGLLSSIIDGELGLYVGLNGGASGLGHKGSSLSRIELDLDIHPANYRARLVPAANDELIFDLEEIIHVSAEERYRHELGRGHRESKLPDEQNQTVELIRDVLKGCRVYHFDDTSRDAPVKRQVATADNLVLRDDAANLAPVLLRLQRSSRPEDKAAYRRITGAVRLVAPFFKEFVLEDEYGTDRIRLRWLHKDIDGVFSAEQMSDGTQVLITTQSVTLMNQFAVEDIIVVEQHDGSSVFRRPKQEALHNWLEEYSPGEVWEKNLIGGQPGSKGSVLDD
ncbi:AAA family ATPase [Amycolatopsis sp.]|uniref:AAA family ATPase n=1 Tax=Amycolatopsis sp. TaxID=37632 RepID=UPI002D80CEB5|nr:AAA family ATPase [Amycolatopsis sp.]HET6710168.1 AAA family ATPase [Amycolatopsis sp.]